MYWYFTVWGWVFVTLAVAVVASVALAVAVVIGIGYVSFAVAFLTWDYFFPAIPDGRRK